MEKGKEGKVINLFDAEIEFFPDEPDRASRIICAAALIGLGLLAFGLPAVAFWAALS